MIWDVIIQIQQFLSTTPVNQTLAVRDLNTSTPELLADTDARNAELLIDFSGNGLSASNCIKSTGPFALSMQTRSTINDSDWAELYAYLPYALLPHYANAQNRCFAISHFAQTLDGRIASVSGDSKWIGNEENLTHAHKMRALCDAILVGAKTMRVDHPRLNVRHVAGKHPVRVIIGGHPDELSIPTDTGGPILHIGCDLEKSTDNVLCLERASGSIDCREILSSLYARDIKSVYIEGGAITTSLFMQKQAIDQVQVHISPVVLGSGTTGFQFDGANSMSEATTFKNPRFIPMGNQVMFIGELT